MLYTCFTTDLHSLLLKELLFAGFGGGLDMISEVAGLGWMKPILDLMWWVETANGNGMARSGVGMRT